MTKEQVLKVQTMIDEAKVVKIELDTRMKAILEGLKKDYGVNTIVEAEDLLDKKEAEIEAMEKDIASKEKELEEAYDWDL